VKEMLDTDGNWSGTLFAAEGMQARIELRLRDQEGEVSLTVVSDDPREAPKEGKVRVRRSNDEIRLLCALEQGAQSLEITGRIQSLRVHAEAVIYGTFEMRNARSQSKEVGVVIIWRFAGIH
jgi:hypothetical protein